MLIAILWLVESARNPIMRLLQRMGLHELTFPNSAAPEALDDKSRYHQVWWWKLSLCDLWPGSIYCRLSWTVPSGVHCTSLVPQLCLFSPCVFYDWFSFGHLRCAAHADNLSNGILIRPCSLEQTVRMVQVFELWSLWKDCGIVGDIVVHYFGFIEE